MLNFTREETIARLFSLTARGIKYDLDRMLIAVRRLGNPQSACRSFHVAGTNGKGSTCAFIASILRAHGHRVGLYTSPHIIDFEERFIIDGRPVATEAWMAVYQAIEPAIADLNLTFFEITSIICFELFKRERVDYAVFETGMGGRLDATNVVTPVASVVTSIGIDHAEYLGPDLLSISREKLGIVKPGVPLVMIRSPEETIMRLASETCERLGSLLHVVEERQATGIVEEECRCSFTAAGVRYRLPLAGRFQIVNALAAI
jgi:dihydrofolate synthase/folylpolyglutamate synthase